MLELYKQIMNWLCFYFKSINFKMLAVIPLILLCMEISYEIMYKNNAKWTVDILFHFFIYLILCFVHKNTYPHMLELCKQLMSWVCFNIKRTISVVSVIINYSFYACKSHMKPYWKTMSSELCWFYYIFYLFHSVLCI